MQAEINRQIIKAEEQYGVDVDAIVLYTLHAHFGFGKKRLYDFWKAVQREREKLIAYYQMPDDSDYVWLCHKKLKEIGVDLQQWYKEDGSEVTNDGTRSDDCAAQADADGT
jgi:hypothetical protein